MGQTFLPTDIPTLPPQPRNRQVIIARRPSAIPQPEHFEIRESAIPEPAAGQFRLRNIYLSVDPAQRGWASSEANYAPPVALGEPMRALAVGVVDASRCPGVAEGDYLYGWFGWQDYAVAEPSAILLRAARRLPLAQFAGLLGINGLTAHLALTRLGRPEQGDTLLVTTAAGAVGSLVGQIGHILGCRTLGFTGSDEKVASCRDRFGYDMAWNYKTVSVDEVLEHAAPRGVNIFYDNTGGSVLDLVLRRMAIGGRIVQCGTASVAGWSPVPMGLRNEREVLTRRLQWGGFVIFDHIKSLENSADQLTAWYQAGKIDLQLEVLSGIEHAPRSIRDLYNGTNTGKRLICLA